MFNELLSFLSFQNCHWLSLKHFWKSTWIKGMIYPKIVKYFWYPQFWLLTLRDHVGHHIDFSWKFLLGKKIAKYLIRVSPSHRLIKIIALLFTLLQPISWLNLCYSKNYLCLRDDRKFPTSVTNTSGRLPKFALWVIKSQSSRVSHQESVIKNQ